jgi:hypothetical protein
MQVLFILNYLYSQQREMKQNICAFGKTIKSSIKRIFTLFVIISTVFWLFLASNFIKSFPGLVNTKRYKLYIYKGSICGLQTTYLHWDTHKGDQIHLRYLQDRSTSFSKKLQSQRYKIKFVSKKQIEKENHTTRGSTNQRTHTLHTWMSLNSNWKWKRVLSPISLLERDLTLLNWMPVMLFSTEIPYSQCSKLTFSFGRLNPTYKYQV